MNLRIDMSSFLSASTPSRLSCDTLRDPTIDRSGGMKHHLLDSHHSHRKKLEKVSQQNRAQSILLTFSKEMLA